LEFLLFERCPTEGRISCVQTNSESVLVLPTAAKSGAKRSMLTEGYDVLLTLVCERVNAGSASVLIEKLPLLSAWVNSAMRVFLVAFACANDILGG
jgi:hypothetical protein